MKVLYISSNMGSGIIKEGRALAKSGVEITWAYQNLAWGDAKNLFPDSIRYTDMEDLSNIIGDYQGDIVHVNAHPCQAVCASKRKRPDLPIILSWRDIRAIVKGGATTDEMVASRNADAFIFYSNGDVLEADRIYGLGNKPRMVNLHYCNEDDYPKERLANRGGIVYEGNINVFADHRDYRKIAKAITDMGYEFHIYPSPYSQGTNHAKSYEDCGAIVHESLPHPELIKELTQYDWCFVGSPVKHLQWDIAMTNKLFDAVSAGIPSMVYLAKETSRYVSEEGLGITIETLEEIPAMYKGCEYLKEVLWKSRWKYPMEKHIQPVIDFYQTLMRRAA